MPGMLREVSGKGDQDISAGLSGGSGCSFESEPQAVGLVGRDVTMTRVFMLLSDSLFGKGVESLLRRSSDIEIVGQATDMEAAKASIIKVQPDVVVVDEALCKDLLSANLDTLKTGVPMRVVGLSLKDNTVHVYQKEQWEVHQAEDLKTVVCRV